ncbi:peptidase, partial [Streptomyces rubrogriseus]|nr:peptidase [Streptomyces rubrogriseus]
ARAGGPDLLAALVADPRTRAAEVLARAAVEPHAVLARVESHFEPTP